MNSTPVAKGVILASQHAVASGILGAIRGPQGHAKHPRTPAHVFPPSCTSASRPHGLISAGVAQPFLAPPSLFTGFCCSSLHCCSLRGYLLWSPEYRQPLLAKLHTNQPVAEARAEGYTEALRGIPPGNAEAVREVVPLLLKRTRNERAFVRSAVRPLRVSHSGSAGALAGIWAGDKRPAWNAQGDVWRMRHAACQGPL